MYTLCVYIYIYIDRGAEATTLHLKLLGAGQAPSLIWDCEQSSVQSSWGGGAKSLVTPVPVKKHSSGEEYTLEC